MGKEKCQCDLCDCGRHRCPVHITRIEKYIPAPCDPDNFKTSYQVQFKDNPGCCRPKPCLPVLATLQVPKKQPFSGSTESKTAFQEKVLPPRYKKEKEVYEPPSGDMDLETTKSRAFTPKLAEKSRSFKPDLAAERPKELPSFDGLTTTQTFYKSYEGTARQKMCSEHPTNLTVNRGGKMEGVTTTKDSYPPYRSADRRQPIRPVEQTYESGQPFYGVTTTSNCYQGIATSPAAPIPHNPTYKPPSGEMLHETTSKAHYNGALGNRPQPIIPHTVRNPPPQFKGTTTNMETYPVHPVQGRPRRKEKEPYVKPTEKMDTLSHHREYYKPHSVQRRRRLSPIERTPRKASAPLPKFHDKTTHKEQYKHWKQVERQKAFTEPPLMLRIGTGKMSTKTMQQSDFTYRGEKIERVRPIIPQVRVVRNEVPIDSLTSYKTEFRGLQNKCRLADILMKESEMRA